MEERSTAEHMRQFNFSISGMLSVLVARNNDEQKALDAIRLLLSQVKSDFHGFEYADSGKEQVEYAAKLHKRLTKLHAAILKASESDLFSPIDVAELSTNIELLKERIGQ